MRVTLETAVEAAVNNIDETEAKAGSKREKIFTFNKIKSDDSIIIQKTTYNGPFYRLLSLSSFNYARKMIKIIDV